MEDKTIKIYIAGDSTVQTYNEESAPQAGWGQFIQNYFKDNVVFYNHAIGARSSKTFIQEGRLNNILAKIKQDDYLLIQMGHNDASIDKKERYTEPKTEFKSYLSQYIDGAREKNAIPILITPVATLKYEGNKFLNQFPEHTESMRELAKQKNVILIDLMKISLEYLESIGYDEAYKMYMVAHNGTDYAHFNNFGANIIAGLIAKEIKKLKLNISEYVATK